MAAMVEIEDIRKVYDGGFEALSGDAVSVLAAKPELLVVGTSEDPRARGLRLIDAARRAVHACPAS